MIYRISAILAICAALFLSSCASESKTHRDSEVFRYNESAGITSLDPAFARSQSNIWAVNQIFNGLVELNADLHVNPSIAESWTISDSGRVYQFRLREDVYFHYSPHFEDSTRRVIARDFVFSFERLRSSELASPGAWTMNLVDTLYALSDQIFVIELREAFPPFLGLLSMQYCSVVPREVVEAEGGDFGRFPIGTGPFYHKVWYENEKLVLRKNPLYFEFEENTRLPYLESIAITFVPDKQTAFLEFLKGNLDFLSGIDASYKDELLTPFGELNPKYEDRFELHRQPYLNSEYLGFNRQLPADHPLMNPKIREAINTGFDRVSMMRYLRNNIGTPAAHGFIPDGLRQPHDAKYGYDCNPERAEELLEQSGYIEMGSPEITLTTNNSYVDLCEYIQGQLKQIGLNIRVDVVPPSTLRQMMSSGKVDWFRGSWIADYPDPENYMALFYSSNSAPNGPNYTRTNEPVLDSLYRLAKQTISDSIRRSLYFQMDEIVIDRAAIVPLYYDEVLRFTPKGIIGIEGNAMNLLTLKRVRKINSPHQP
jgi:peptide/nickel transport system substrate-binding protein